MFHGSMVALVTPMVGEAVDVKRLCELVDFHIESGTHAIVAAGTTGESGTLTFDEKMLVIRTVIDHANERIPVIAGTGMNGTQSCIDLTEQAMHAGAHAALIMTPAYIKPTQEGLFQHFSSIAKAVPMPIILYNVPSRTACDLQPETVERLAHISNIIGIKEATGDIARLEQLLKDCTDRIDVYSGDDLTASEWMLSGARGVISVSANVAARQMAKLADAAIDNDRTLTLNLTKQLMPLHRAMFVESNPIPVKWALSRMGLITNDIRLPLMVLEKEKQASIETILEELNLI